MKVLLLVDKNCRSMQIKTALTADGIAVEIAPDGCFASTLVRDTTFDVIVLDAGLPPIDGLKVLRDLRVEGIETAVIFLAPDSAWKSRAAALDAGADDCLPKDFAIEEFQSRVRAMLRRHASPAMASYKSGDVVFDSQANRVQRDGVTVTLTIHEIAVLSYLFHNSDRLVSRNELTAHIYKKVSERGSNTIAVFVNRLRRKLGNDLIETVRGRGYVIKSSGY